MPTRHTAVRRERATAKRVRDSSNGDEVIGMRTCTIRNPLASERKRSLERKGWDGEPSYKSPLSRVLTLHSDSRSSRGLLPEKPDIIGFLPPANKMLRDITSHFRKRPTERSAGYDIQRSTAEQWVKGGKRALKWTVIIEARALRTNNKVFSRLERSCLMFVAAGVCGLHRPPVCYRKSKWLCWFSENTVQLHQAIPARETFS